MEEDEKVHEVQEETMSINTSQERMKKNGTCSKGFKCSNEQLRAALLLLETTSANMKSKAPGVIPHQSACHHASPTSSYFSPVIFSYLWSANLASPKYLDGAGRQYSFPLHKALYFLPFQLDVFVCIQNKWLFHETICEEYVSSKKTQPSWLST